MLGLQRPVRLPEQFACDKHQIGIACGYDLVGMAGLGESQGYTESGRRIKYASAHDLRRSCAERLINLGVSAETLMVIMRHKDFATTRKFYGAKRAAQAAAAEVHQKLVVGEKADDLVRDVEQLGTLSPEEMKTLKRLLKSLREPAENK
jgi:hypothetical protein